MPINMLEYFAGPSWGYLTGSHDVVMRVYPTRIVQMKSFKQRFPCDVWAIRDGNICFCHTENGQANGWSDPKDFKLNVDYKPVFCPLVIDSLPWESSVDDSAVHESFVGGVWDGKYNHLRNARTRVLQPVSMPMGGDVGQVDVLQIEWLYGNVREIYFQAKFWGQVGWQEQSLNADGVYVTNVDSKSGKPKVSLFNKKVLASSLPEPIFGFPASWLP